MAILPTYPRTKPTPIPWIGEVPEHWEVVQLRRFVSMQSGESITAEDIKEEGDHAVFGGNGLRGYTGSFTHDGDHVLIGRQGALCGNVNYATGKFWASEHAVVVTPVKASATRWLGELMRTMNLNQHSQSAAQPGLAVDVIKGLYVPLPPLPEQTHIARYLSYKTALIDAYLARKRRMMALLKEQRQALISQAVTKGLDPNVPMKDSGVEWIGEVPEHWEVRRLSSVARVMSGKAHEQFIDPDGEYICVTARFVSSDGHAQKYCTQNFSPTQRGDVLMVMSDLPNGRALARAFHVDDDTVYAVNQRVCIIRPSAINSKFLAYAANRNDGLMKNNDGSNQTHLSVSDFTTLPLAYPPLGEQDEIVRIVEQTVSLIDDELIRIERSMERVREYRQALISAVVTGKVDVRGVEVPEEDQMISGSDDQIMEADFALSSDDAGTGTDVDGIAEL